MNTENIPTSFAELENLFGKPNQSGFGSAVFCHSKCSGHEVPLEDDAKAVYQHFCGENWARFGPESWMGTWAMIHRRQIDLKPQIIEELKAITDPGLRSAALLLLDSGDDPMRARKILSAVFDAPDMTQLQIFSVGDGAAMSGVLIAGEFKNGTRTFLIILMD